MLYGRFLQSKQVDQAAPFHDPLKTLKFKTLASDCVIKKGVETISLLIYYVKLYIYILNETSKPPVNRKHFFNIAHLLLNCLT